MTITFEPVTAETGSDDEVGQLVFADRRLVAVVVQLSDVHSSRAGRWYLEYGFDRLDGTTHPTAVPH